MRNEVVRTDTNLSSLAFEFFFWFSRFEFALKENKYLRNCNVGAKAEPGWNKFVAKYEGSYVLSNEARALLIAKPEQQLVAEGCELVWDSVNLSDCKSELAKIVRLLRTVRNNLFHGGKHASKTWDDPVRTESLLRSGKPVLDQLAQLGSLEADYTQFY